MSLIDGFLLICILLLFAAVLALGYERQNGHVGGAPPEPTLRRQLEACHHQLATAQQSVDVWRALADKRKEIIDELSGELGNRRD